jgi:hypothetical protein
VISPVSIYEVASWELGGVDKPLEDLVDNSGKVRHGVSQHQRDIITSLKHMLPLNWIDLHQRSHGTSEFLRNNRRKD